METHLVSTLNVPTLRQRLLRAGGWSLSGYVLGQVLRFGTNLITTRLLTPDMFGIMAVAWLVMTALHLFSDVGLGQSVVQSRRGSDPTFLNTVWAVQVRRGALVSLGAVATAVVIALMDHLRVMPPESVYGAPILPYVIAAVSMTGVISGFASTKILEASRNLKLKRVTQLELLSQVAGLMLTLGWLAFERSIWALVMGAVCASLIRTILSHIWLQGVANRWLWNSEAFREIFGFGKWIVLSSVLGFLVNNGDRIVLGWLVNDSVLGVYVIAYLIFQSAYQLLDKLINTVVFPALSEVSRDRRAELKSTYYRLHRTVALVAYFASGLLMVSGSSLVDVLYDRRYAQAGWILQILAAALLTTPMNVANQCFLALGASNLLPKVIIVRLIALFGLTVVGFQVAGLHGAVVGTAISYFSEAPLVYFYLKSFAVFDWRKELAILPVVFGGLAAGYVVKLLIAN